MAEYRDYNAIDEKLKYPRNKESKIIENNTKVVRLDKDTVAIRYCLTDIVTYKKNGDIIIDNGGYHWSRMTYERINRYIPESMCVERKNGQSVVYMHKHDILESFVLFFTSVTIPANKKTTKCNTRDIGAVEEYYHESDNLLRIIKWKMGWVVDARESVGRQKTGAEKKHIGVKCGIKNILSGKYKVLKLRGDLKHGIVLFEHNDVVMGYTYEHIQEKSIVRWHKTDIDSAFSLIAKRGWEIKYDSRDKRFNHFRHKLLAKGIVNLLISNTRREQKLPLNYEIRQLKNGKIISFVSVYISSYCNGYPFFKEYDIGAFYDFISGDQGSIRGLLSYGYHGIYYFPIPPITGECNIRIMDYTKIPIDLLTDMKVQIAKKMILGD